VFIGVEKIGKLKINLSGVDFRQFEKNKKGGFLFLGRSTFIDVEFTCEVAMSSESGLLEFRVICQGRECGTAEISFDQD
jgi:hypothetical protein